MHARNATMILLLSLFFFQLQTVAQTPNFTGRWILNMQKSKLEDKSEGFTGSIFIITQEGKKLRLTRYHLFGEKKNRISFRMIADGKMRRVKILFKGKLEQTENGLRATLWRKNFSNIVNYQFGESQDEFIADEVMKSKTDSHHNVWVFDRERSQ